MSNNNNTKKRRVGAGGGARVSIDGGGESGGSELAAIKSMMQELVQQNNTQTNMINCMQAEITQLSKKCTSQNRTQTNMMQNMQGDITGLSKKCDTMETTIKNVKLSQSKSLAAIKTLQSVHGVNSDNTQLDDINLRFDKLEQTIEKKHIKLDGRLTYHDILLQNQKWVYSAPYPSAEYWNNLDGDGNRVAKDFLRQIKVCTEEMRYGQGNGELTLNAHLPYNRVFLPHWKEFANALKQYHYHLKHSTELRDNSKLYLWNMELPDEVVDLLSNALQSTHFKTIALIDNNFGQKGIDFVLDYLKINHTLKTFSLANNSINNMDDINKLSKIMKQHPSIENLALGNCNRTDVNGYEMLKMVMNAGKNKLKTVRLYGSGISTEGGTFISDFMAKSTILVDLYLDGNELDDQDAFQIAESLKQNRTLRLLRLTNNNITKTGWTALRKVEFDDTSLNAAADSNHACSIKYPPDGSDLIEGLDISEMNGDRNGSMAFASKGVRQKKIYTVLSSRNRDCSNVKYFENVPVELLPDMLHSVQKYSTYHVPETEEDKKYTPNKNDKHVTPLSIVYEVCRHWDESLAVFEALSS